MNIFKKLYCRTVHVMLKLVSPLLPYRAPTFSTYEEAAQVFRSAGKRKLLLVTGKNVHARGLCEPLLSALEGAMLQVEIFDSVPADPSLTCVEEALALYRERECDCVAAVGGGSPMDCAKGVCARLASPKKSLKKMRGALKVRGKVPLFLAVPTTAGSGSEMTAAAVFTDEVSHDKFAVFSYKIVPKIVVADPSLTRSLPPAVTADTGMDALTHAVEAYIGRATTRNTRAHAESAVRAIFSALPKAYADGNDMEARRQMLFASGDAGIAFTLSYVGYVHALAHALGGAYHFPHGRLCAILLPKVLRAYGKKAQKKLARLAVLCGFCDEHTKKDEAAERFIGETERLLALLGMPETLSFPEADIPALARHAAREANPLYPVPRLLGERELIRILNNIAQ